MQYSAYNGLRSTHAQRVSPQRARDDRRQAIRRPTFMYIYSGCTVLSEVQNIPD